MNRLAFNPPHSRSTRFAALAAFAVASLVCAFWVRNVISEGFLLPFIVLVVASAQWFGVRGGLTATSVGIVAGIFLSRSMSMGTTVAAAALLTFAAVSGLVTWLIETKRQANGLLTATLCSIADGTIVTDTAGKVVFLNPAAETLLGWHAAEAVGRTLADVFHVKDEGSGAVKTPSIETMLKEGNRGHSSTHTLLAKDGSQSAVEENVAPIRGSGGNFLGAIIVFRDVTKRLEVQDQLTHSQKMDAIARLAGGVAGDFNNLLTVITGYSEMLRSEMAVGNPLRRFAEEIFAAAERAAGLTRQLLAFSRGQVVQPKLLDPNALLTSMETMISRLLGDSVELIPVPGPGVGKIKADPGQFEQIIVNLAMNSRDAMPQGGRFVIETSNVEINDEAASARAGLTIGSYVMIAVSDTGAGMDAETRSRLFEPFFTTKGQGKGSGLGLSIVYGIVRQSLGHINVYSQVDAGTIFEIYFPRAKDSFEPVHRPKGRQHLRGNETLLIADDEDGVRKLVHAVLATNGYTVIEARDGVEALQLYETHRARIDMVLTDVVMPRMNGFELAEKISAADPKLKLLYMSGYRDNPVGKYTEESDRPILHKPFTPDVLLSRVRETLDVVGK